MQPCFSLVLYHFKLFGMAHDLWLPCWNFTLAEASGMHDMEAPGHILPHWKFNIWQNFGLVLAVTAGRCQCDPWQQTDFSAIRRVCDLWLSVKRVSQVKSCESNVIVTCCNFFLTKWQIFWLIHDCVPRPMLLIFKFQWFILVFLVWVWFKSFKLFVYLNNHGHEKLLIFRNGHGWAHLVLFVIWGLVSIIFHVMF